MIFNADKPDHESEATADPSAHYDAKNQQQQKSATDVKIRHG